MTVGTVVHFFDPNRPREGFIRELVDCFLNLSEEEAGRISVGDRIWMWASKVSGSDKLRSAMSLVEITDCIKSYEYKWQCGPFTGTLNGKGMVFNIQITDDARLEAFRDKYPDRFGFIEQMALVA
ncbi:MAG: hypothetical protein A2431_02770 [Candidatus Zambryskibacteria bacterium RIFOXYC1_FULL_39_10]|uniref:Uncharacterized protein n=1 Tax=Candidatus Zambryskibacteria bacterium RIFOXYC1_FULL_39_10 TaxID=1802779 RepID=A0A1G2UXY8_9BACT|nr:MAG: hypothetical protein A2431_02770 [Candidatus Zambryskibacteria bacterium RIFOXYC1_FULL_39_10]OHB14801.1 MAG: hypothetical protein A2605_04070 [Candidatus Zambryskibacteria bacterium RIFOXYD1_FULL_39_35]